MLIESENESQILAYQLHASVNHDQKLKSLPLKWKVQKCTDMSDNKIIEQIWKFKYLGHITQGHRRDPDIKWQTHIK